MAAGRGVELRLLRADGRPAAGALVAVAGAPAPVPDLGLLADDEGRLRLEAPLPGRYLLRVWLDGAAQDLEVALGPAQLAGPAPGTVTLRLQR